MGRKARKHTPGTGALTTWITLNEARTLVIEKVLAPKLAERMILEALRAGNVRWRCWRIEGRKHRDDPDLRPGDPAYWEVETTGRQIVKLLDVCWPESRVRHLMPIGVSVYRVEVPREDIAALLENRFGPAPHGSQPVIAEPQIEPKPSNTKVKPKNEWALDRIRTVLPLLPAVLDDGRSLADLTDKEVINLKEFKAEYAKRDWKLPSDDSVGKVRRPR